MVNFSQLFYLMTRVRLSERYQVSHIITLIGTFQRHKNMTQAERCPHPAETWYDGYLGFQVQKRGFTEKKGTSP